MKVLVTGASGLLGRSVYSHLRERGHTVTGTGWTRASPANGLIKVDLTDWSALSDVLDDVKPDVIVHTAAERRPDVVEKEPEASYAINVDVPTKLAAWCTEGSDNDGDRSTLLINISTDYVFDGRSPPYVEDDTPNPLNAYGKSKWQGEQGVRASGAPGRSVSIRVPVLYGRTETNEESAVNVLLDAVLTKKTKKMDANATRFPTNVDDVAKAIEALIDRFGNPTDDNKRSAIPHTLHFSAAEPMTKYDMSLVMARCLRAANKEGTTDHLVPEYDVDPNAATSRPQNCQLDVSAIRQVGVDVSCVPFEQVSHAAAMCFLSTERLTNMLAFYRLKWWKSYLSS